MAEAQVGVQALIARDLIEAGRFDEALAILRPLARNRTVEVNLLFLTGLAAMGAAQRPGISDEVREALLDEAVAVFRSMLVKRPALALPCHDKSC